ncbi:MAG: hypothetical protein FJ278_17280, partial [Planctomycetes bacterium]|nr:hypothetical protein [Planctomycetota bacterium]
MTYMRSRQLGAFSWRTLLVIAASALSCLGETVWDGLDVTTRPLDVEVIRTQKEGDVDIQVLRFTSEAWEGQPMRVFAMYGKPEGAGKFPGVLHIHGGGQTASPRDVAEMVKRGYACFSFDWTGPLATRTEYTDWPKSITPHNTLQSIDKHNKLYHAVLAARRGLTFLAARPEVDGDRMGAYGISWGGHLMWLINGTDSRLKAAVAIYGCGGLLSEGIASAVRISAQSLPSAQVEEWARHFDPLRYGPRQHAPIMHLTGSNDFFGWPTAGGEALRSCKVDTRQSYLAGVNHGVGLAAAEAAYRWLAHYLKGEPPLPASPTVEVALSADGVPEARVKLADEPNVESAWLEYSLGPSLPPGRCWRIGALEKKGDARLAAMPILDPSQELLAIAQAKHKGGFKLSSLPVSIIPAKLGAALGTLKPSLLISDFGDGLGGWGPWVGSTQLYGQRSDLALDPSGHDGRPCLKIVPLVQPFPSFVVTLWRVGDPQWNGGESAALSLWVKGAEKALSFMAVERVQQVGEREFTASAPLKPESGWQQVIVRRDQFKDKKGDPLASWRDVQVIQISGPCAKGDAPRL